MSRNGLEQLKNIVFGVWSKAVMLVAVFVVVEMVILSQIGIVDSVSGGFYKYMQADGGVVAGEFEVRMAQSSTTQLEEFTDHFISTIPATALGWGWKEGTAVYGVWKAYEATGKATYLNYVRDYYDYHLDASGNIPLVAAELYDHTAPGIALTYLYEQTGDEKYRNGIQNLVNFVMNDINESRVDVNVGGEVLSCLRWQDSMLTDAVFMNSIFMVRAGNILSNSTYINEGVNFMRCHLGLTVDSATGIFYHLYDVSTNTVSTQQWGRGNGWMAVALVDVYDNLPSNNAYGGAIRSALVNLLSGLGGVQDSSGLWYNLINRAPDYCTTVDHCNKLETSGPAFFAYTYKRAKNLGIMGSEHDGVITSVDNALASKVVSNVLTEMIGPTAPRSNDDNYLMRSYSDSNAQVYGAGAYMMSLAEGGGGTVTPPPPPLGTHPTLLFTVSDASLIKQHIENGDSPWVDQYNYVLAAADAIVNDFNSKSAETCRASSGYNSKIRCVATDGISANPGDDFINFSRPMNDDDYVVFHSGYSPWDPSSNLIYWDGIVPDCSGGDYSTSCQQVGYTGFYNLVNSSDYKFLYLAYAILYGDNPDRYVPVLKEYMLAWTNMEMQSPGTLRNQATILRFDSLLNSYLLAYDIAYDYLDFSSSERSTVENWMKTVAAKIYEQQQSRIDDVNHNITQCNNATINLEARFFGDSSKVNHTNEQVKRYIDAVIQSDGSINDRYHGGPYDNHNGLQLTCMSYVAITSYLNGGEDLFHYTSPGGKSIDLAFDYYSPVFQDSETNSTYEELYRYRGLTEIGSTFVGNASSIQALQDSSFDRTKRNTRFTKYAALLWGYDPSGGPLPLCDYTAWQDAGCNIGSCGATEMQQTRSATVGGCNLTERCVSSVSCGATPPPPGSCGDGSLDSGEDCDDGNTVGGDGCSSTCQIESGSSGGVLIPDFNCDGKVDIQDFGVMLSHWGQTSGFDVACDSSKSIDVSPDDIGTDAIEGDGVVNSYDMAKLLSCWGRPTAESCWVGTVGGGTDPITPPPAESCNNNGLKEDGENCDGPDLAGESCQTLGFDTGILTCNVECNFVTSDCSDDPPDNVCEPGFYWNGTQCVEPNLSGTCEQRQYSRDGFPVPNINPPGVGNSYTDQIFCMDITQISDTKKSEIPNSEVGSFNVDNTMFLADITTNRDTGGLDGGVVWNADGSVAVDLLNDVRSDVVRWARAGSNTANTFFIVNGGSSVQRCTVSGGSYSCINQRDLGGNLQLPGDPRCEGDMSFDGRRWLLQRGSRLIVYDPVTENVISESQAGLVDNMDTGSISAAGNWALVAYKGESAFGDTGIVQYDYSVDGNWTKERNVHFDHIHWAVGIDIFGNDVVYTAVNGNDSVERPPSEGLLTGDFVSINLSNGEVRPLFRAGLLGHSLSVPRQDRNEYFYINSGHSAGEGNAYYKEIIEVPTDGSGWAGNTVRRLAHHLNESTVTDLGFVNNDGSQYVFQSNKQTIDLTNSSPLSVNKYYNLYTFDIPARDSSGGTEPPGDNNCLGSCYANTCGYYEGGCQDSTANPDNCDVSRPYCCVGTCNVPGTIGDNRTSLTAVVLPDGSFDLTNYTAGQSVADPNFTTSIDVVTDGGGFWTGNSWINSFSANDRYFFAAGPGRAGGPVVYGDVDSASLISGGLSLPSDETKLRWIKSTGDYYCDGCSGDVYTVTSANIDSLYYLYDGTGVLKMCDISGSCSDLKDFGDGSGERKTVRPTDVSFDSRYVLVDFPDGDETRLLVYDAKSSAGTSYESPSNLDLSLDSLSMYDAAVMSPDGDKVVLAWWGNGLDGHNGLEVWSNQWEFIRQIVPQQSRRHNSGDGDELLWAVGYDGTGRQMVFTQVHNPISCSSCVNQVDWFKSNATMDDVTRANLSNGDIIGIYIDNIESSFEVSLMLDVPEYIPAHFSAPHGNGSQDYFYVQFETTGDEPSNDWNAFFGEIVKVPTDGSQAITRLVHHGDTSDYMGRFNASNDGSKILFATDYDWTDVEGNNVNRNLYMIDTGGTAAVAGAQDKVDLVGLDYEWGMTAMSLLLILLVSSSMFLLAFVITKLF